MDRLKAEEDSVVKQVLTYIMLTRGPDLLSYKRGSFSLVADFLRGSQCVGFGGHVSERDRSLFTWNDMGVRASAGREIGEELRCPQVDKERLRVGDGLELVGAINDDSSDIGQRHFAFLYRYEVSGDPAWNQPERGERSVTQLQWIEPSDPPILLWDFEYWSQLCLREFFPSLARAAPAYRMRRRAPLRPPHVLCVVGEVGSGKSEAVECLQTDLGYTVINSGKVIAKLLGLPPVPKTGRAEFQDKAWAFIRSEHGPSTLAAALAAQTRKVRSGRALVDGIRQRATLDALRAQLADFALGLLFVHAPVDLAYQFYRDRENPTISIFDFLKLRNSPVESEVRGLIELGDAVLYNWTGRLEYRRAVRALMQSALRSGR